MEGVVGTLSPAQAVLTNLKISRPTIWSGRSYIRDVPSSFLRPNLPVNFLGINGSTLNPLPDMRFTRSSRCMCPPVAVR